LPGEHLAHRWSPLSKVIAWNDFDESSTLLRDVDAVADAKKKGAQVTCAPIVLPEKDQAMIFDTTPVAP
jgi:hypothetical protein